MDKFYTRVVFKMTPPTGFCDSDCIAFILDGDANAGNVLSYMHVGQHSEASIEFAKECTNATESQYKDLKEELESMGYELEVCENLP